MCEQTVSQKAEPVQANVSKRALALKQEAESASRPIFIKRKEHRRRLGISRAKEYTLLKGDPDHPKPIPPFGYLEHESAQYIEVLIARRDADNGHDK
jgi:hypothetical protein